MNKKEELQEVKKDFTIKFRGTRGSYPCAKKGFLDFGGNTACVEVHCGEQLIILDAGTGLIDVGTDEVKNLIISQKPHQSTILISHIHQDHIQGLQFYKPLFIKNSTINLFGLSTGDENLKDTLRNILFDKVFPLSLEEIRCNFDINNLTSDDMIVISQDGTTNIYNDIKKDVKTKKDDIIITVHKTSAHPRNGCLCIKIQYRSKTLVYATDKESYIGLDKKFIQFAYEADCLIHDAQYTYQDYINPVQPKQGFGHSTFEMAIETAQLAKAKKLFFFHYDPDYDDEKLSNLESEYTKEPTIMFAKENYEIKL